jgi:uncharacterized membrane protein
MVNRLNTELNPIRHLLALAGAHHFVDVSRIMVNRLNTQLNPIRHLLALAGAHHFVDVSRIMVNRLNTELNPIHHLLALAGAPHFVDVSRIRVNNTVICLFFPSCSEFRITAWVKILYVILFHLLPIIWNFYHGHWGDLVE